MQIMLQSIFLVCNKESGGYREDVRRIQRKHKENTKKYKENTRDIQGEYQKNTKSPIALSATDSHQVVSR